MTSSSKDTDSSGALSLPPDCYAVIFTSQRTETYGEDYSAMADHMIRLAKEQPGFIAVDSARNPDGSGITVSYWTDEAAIRAWKAHAEHRLAQNLGKERWYETYTVTVAKVTRTYGKRG